MFSYRLLWLHTESGGRNIEMGWSEDKDTEARELQPMPRILDEYNSTDMHGLFVGVFRRNMPFGFLLEEYHGAFELAFGVARKGGEPIIQTDRKIMNFNFIF